MIYDQFNREMLSVWVDYETFEIWISVGHPLKTKSPEESVYFNKNRLEALFRHEYIKDGKLVENIEAHLHTFTFTFYMEQIFIWFQLVRQNGLILDYIDCRLGFLELLAF